MQPEAYHVMIAISFSNSYEVFQPIETYGDNPGSNKAVQVGHVKGGDKVFSILASKADPISWQPKLTKSNQTKDRQLPQTKGMQLPQPQAFQTC